MIESFTVEIRDTKRYDVDRPHGVYVWTESQIAAIKSGRYNPVTMRPAQIFTFKTERGALAFFGRLESLRSALAPCFDKDML